MILITKCFKLQTPVFQVFSYNNRSPAFSRILKYTYNFNLCYNNNIPQKGKPLMSSYNKEKIYELFDNENISYERIDHEAVFTMEELDKLEFTKRANVFKNLFLRDAKGKIHYLVSVPENVKVDMKTLQGKINSTRLSFASAERLAKYLSLTQGSVSPLGVLNDVNHEVIIVFDKNVSDNEIIAVHPNDNTSSALIRFAELVTLITKAGNQIMFVDFN